MTNKTTVASYKRIIAYAVCYLLFGLSVWLGFTQGPNDFFDSDTVLQRVCSTAVTLYGVFGLGAGIGLARRKSWSLVMTRAWCVAIVTAAIAAPLGWAPGETPWWGVALGGIVAAALAFGVLRMVRMLLQRPGPPSSSRV